MARGVEAALARRASTASTAWSTCRPATVPATAAHPACTPARPAGSNHPTAEGVAGPSRCSWRWRSCRGRRTLALCLLSGGGSALLPAPVEGVSLEDKQEVTRLLHACGATIDEMNCVRKHLSRVKGGRLGAGVRASGCPVVSLIISDVIGDPLDVIASGPTAPDPTTFADALAVLERYGLDATACRRRCSRHLERGAPGEVARDAEGAAAARAQRHPRQQRRLAGRGGGGGGGARLPRAQPRLVHRGRDAARRGGAGRRRAEHPARRRAAAPPACLLSGGETTVTLGDGPRQGRPQPGVRPGRAG